MSTQLNFNFLKRALTILVVCLGFSLNAAHAVDTGNLRKNDLDVEPPAVPLKKNIEGGIFDRAFVEQPPLIPHDIRGYQIDRNVNKCLSCHSWKNAKKWNATRISVTHFKDRDGNQLADVAPGRYFCLQCHVPQVDAKPLIENKFKPVDSLN